MFVFMFGCCREWETTVLRENKAHMCVCVCGRRVLSFLPRGGSRRTFAILVSHCASFHRLPSAFIFPVIKSTFSSILRLLKWPIARKSRTRSLQPLSLSNPLKQREGILQYCVSFSSPVPRLLLSLLSHIDCSLRKEVFKREKGLHRPPPPFHTFFSILKRVSYLFFTDFKLLL